MSFSSLVFKAATRLFPDNSRQADIEKARSSSFIAHPWRAWSERRRERSLAEKDRLFATSPDPFLVGGMSDGVSRIIAKYNSAARSRNLDELAALLRHETRVGERSEGREIALSNLCVSTFDWKKSIPAIELLLPRCEINAPFSDDTQGATIFMLICDENSSAARLIIKNKSVEAGGAVLSGSARVGSSELERLGSAKDNRGLTALMRAARASSLPLVEALAPISDVNARCEHSGWTALMTAAQNGDVEIAQVLAPLSDLRALNHRGQSAVEIAQGNGHYDIAALLERMELEQGHVASSSHSKRSRL